MITLYGISNCDTVKKARAWLVEYEQVYEFHDFKKSGVPPQQLTQWVHAVGWEKLLNRQGTTWRKLSTEEQAAVHDAASAQALMLAHPSVIKRPVVNWGDGTTVGFNAAAWLDRTGR